jgi:hypothetical protein
LRTPLWRPCAADYGGTAYTAAAFDGAEYLVLRARYLQSGIRAMFGFFDNDTQSWSSKSTYTTTSKGLPASMIWTGSGFIAAASTFSIDEIYAFPSDHREIAIQLFSVNANASSVTSWMLETHGGLYPQLAWAGGRVALSWVRVDEVTRAQNRYLAFLDCD